MHINNVLSTSNIPPINSTTFKWRERRKGKTIETVARASFQDSLSTNSLNKERQQNVSGKCNLDEHESICKYKVST